MTTSPRNELPNDSGGANAPPQFEPPEREYRQALTHAVIFERSQAGKIEVAGADAAAFLHNLCTNDITGLPIGMGCEAYFCDRRAKTLAHALIYNQSTAARPSYWLDVTPGYSGKLLQHLDKHLISEAVELIDLTQQFAQFHLAGATATNVLTTAAGNVPKLAEFQEVACRLGDGACQLRRNDWLGLPGYDIVCPKDRADAVRGALQAAGASLAGADTLEVLRIEAGAPIYGIDIDEGRFVMEIARAARAVSFAKGCYIGQEPIVMARDRAGFVNRAFLGMKVLDGGLLPAGTNLWHNAGEVGVVTSSIYSPRLQAPLALGYVRRGHQEPGTRLEAETPDGRRRVEMLPFPPLG